MGADRVPTLREPEFGAAIAAVLDELQVFVLRDQPIGQIKGRQEHVMGGRLVVKGKARAAVADACLAGRIVGPAGRRAGRQRDRGGGLVGGQRGVAGQQVLQIGEDELLVLFFVVHAQFDDLAQGAVITAPRQERGHGLFDFVPVIHHLFEAGPGEQAALRARMALAHGLVVGIEQHAVLRVAWPVARVVAAQHKGLEEPGGMREMPFDRAAIGHGLGLAVFGGQGRGQRFGDGAQLQQPVGQIGGLDAGLGMGERAGRRVGGEIAGGRHGWPVSGGHERP